MKYYLTANKEITLIPIFSSAISLTKVLKIVLNVFFIAIFQCPTKLCFGGIKAKAINKRKPANKINSVFITFCLEFYKI